MNQEVGSAGVVTVEGKRIKLKRVGVCRREGQEKLPINNLAVTAKEKNRDQKLIGMESDHQHGGGGLQRGGGKKPPNKKGFYSMKNIFQSMTTQSASRTRSELGVLGGVFKHTGF